MKNLFSFLILQVIFVFSLDAQSVSDYSYKLTNGVTIRTEHCWNQVWIQQTYAPLKKDDKVPLAVNIRALGDLISSSSYKLQSAGKEVKMQGATPGTYDLKLSFKLSGTPGDLIFTVKNILIKPDSKTNVSVTLYDYQYVISESKASLNGLSAYETLVDKCKSHTAQDVYLAVPAFYAKGIHDKPLLPEGTPAKTSGKLKPGTYDLLITIVIADQNHKIWFENFTLKPDMQYKITTNLNAGGIMYSGVEKNLKSIHLYPAGTAASQTGAPAPIKNLETIMYDDVRSANCCSPGTYDILLNFRNGSKYEWRKNIAISTGSKTEIK